MVHAGIALELLCKALVSKTSPTLLLDLTGTSGKTLESIIAVSRLDAGHLSFGDGLPHTLSAGSILNKMLPKVHPHHGLALGDVNKLLTARNMYVHWGYEVDERQLIDLIPRFAREANKLIKLLDASNEWWGEEGEYAALLSDKQIKATKIKAHAARRDAEQNLARFSTALGDDDLALKNLLDEKSARGIKNLIGDIAFFPFPCPVCNHRGAYKGFWDISWEWGYEYENGDYYAHGASPESGTFVADSFECFACGFRLSSPDELEAANFELKDSDNNDLDLDLGFDFGDLIGDADPSDFMDHY